MSGYSQSPQNPFSAPESDLAPERYASDVGPITYATLWQRFAAAFLDGIIVFVLGASISYVMELIIGMNPRAVVSISRDNVNAEAELRFRFAAGVSSLFILGVWWLYYALQESSAAQATLGKRAIGLRVTDLEGRRISLARATGRFLAETLFPVFIGMVMTIPLLMITSMMPFLAVPAYTLCFLLGHLIQPFTARKQALHDIVAGTLVLKD
jgi:uncharacterized RDD family membrane protein YckC